MFGDLFAEEEDEEKTVTVANGKVLHSFSRKSAKVLQGPPPVRGPTKLCGLVNQGGTCYLNSLIQTLFFTPEFRENLLRLGPDELGELSEECTSSTKARVIPLQLQHLFSQMLLLNKESVCTSNLTDSFGWTQSEGFQQHDVQELNRILFSAIESSLVGTSGENLIRNLYHGNSVSKITCQECGQVSEREEDFLDLSMILTGCTSLEQSLSMSYIHSELMEGNNQYMCESCNQLVDAIRSAQLRSLPSILTFSLVRFTYDLQKFERYKETHRYAFPLELDMRRFCEEQREEDTYELYSVVIHRGSCYGGHYHAYIRDFEGLGLWTSPDKQVALSLVADKQDDVNEYSDPLQLIFLLVKKLGGKVSISDISQLMVKETGISWNKKFKKHYGPMTKFIKKHADVFDMAEGPAVGLKCSDCEVQDLQAKSTKHQVNDTTNNKHQDAKSSACDHPVPVDKFLDQVGDTVESEDDQSSLFHWFDLNDSKLTCIDEHEIKKQFAGKESAYMLFYRRKNELTSKRNADSLLTSVSAKLISEVNLKNIELDKQWEEYDLELNRITVSLHLVCDYTVKDGVIVPKQSMSINPPTLLTLDRRKTVTEFLALVNECCFSHQNVVGQDSTVHITVCLPAGLHLYQEITASRSCSLIQCNVDDGSELFIWNGKQVDGHFVRTGLSCEPVLLSITYPSKDGSSVELQKPFPKDSTLSELKVAICKVSGVKPSKLILSIMKSSKRFKTKVEELVSSQDGNTLKELDFRDGQRLVVDKKAKQKKANASPQCLAQTEAEKCDNQITVAVENRCTYDSHEVDYVTEERLPWTVMSVEIDKHKTFGELKRQILSSPDFKSNQDHSYILRVDDVTHGLGPPLYDDQMVEEVLLDNKLTIAIEHGVPLTEHQVAVRFYCAGHSSIEDEMIFDKTQTISNCLRLMTEHAGLNGSNWHLCKTNWYGEIADIFENEEATLENELVKNGDLVVVDTGRLPAKGFVRLSLLLLERSEGRFHNAGVLSWITSGLQDILGVSDKTMSHIHAEKFVSLEEVEISQEDTLLDLKSKIYTILQTREYKVCSPECLRIQEIENGFAARVLRNNARTLRFIKLRSSAKLSVQILQSEETLSQSAILLNVRRRITSKRCYGPPQQLIFDSRDAATPSSLRQFLGEYFDLPVEKLAVAKYVRHKYDWIVISDANTLQGKNKNCKKINLRHSPYHLQDGDTLGVKDALHETLDKNDFSTSEDDAARKNLKLVQEEKIRRQREERRRKTSRRPEIELKIHVEDFTKQ